MKKLLALLLCGTMSIGLLAGCGGTEKENPAADGSLPEDNPEEHITFTYWIYADDYKNLYTSLNDNPVVQYLNDKFNVTMEFQTPAIGSEADNFNLMLGTQDYTDVMNMSFYTESLGTLYEEGVILDLAPYLEEYMPNYYALLQSNDELRRMAYDDEGHMFTLYRLDDVTRNHWGGFVYRRDILETMTGGNVQFPSGNEEPTTVEDWDYMLPLMKEYFEASGLQDTACLIIPAIGYTATGELQAGWGATGIFGLGMDGETVEYGPSTEQFYNYVSKMKEWYDAGYVYQDFASRTNDLFYMPNTSLTYGGAAGVWFGILQQVSDYMSVPDAGLNMDVRAVPAPLDTEHGVTEEMAGSRVTIAPAADARCISSTCDEEKLVRILTLFDYLYTEEGDNICRRGLTAELAADDEIYQKVGLEDGAWYEDENGNYCVNPKTLEADWPDYGMALKGERIAGGTGAPDEDPANKVRDYHNDAEDAASAQWTKYPTDRVLPSGVTLNAEENSVYQKYYTGIDDYVNTMIPKFIIGTEELTEETWNAYVEQLNALGLQELLEAEQSAYERYQER